MISLYEWRKSISDKKFEFLIDAIIKKKFYTPDWKKPDRQWEVITSRRVNDFVILLCRRDKEFAVFTDLVMPKSYPSDKYVSGLKNAIELYTDVVLRTNEL